MEDDRDGPFLDGCWLGVALVCDGAQEVSREPELCELQCVSGSDRIGPRSSGLVVLGRRRRPNEGRGGCGTPPTIPDNDCMGAQGTRAIDSAKRAGVGFEVHEYAHDARAALDKGGRGYALEAVDALGIDAARVFKTIVVSVDGRLGLCVVPADAEVDLKAAADALGGRRATIAQAAEAEKATGYVLGGISPLGTRRPLPVVVDASAPRLPDDPRVRWAARPRDRAGRGRPGRADEGVVRAGRPPGLIPPGQLAAARRTELPARLEHSRQAIDPGPRPRRIPAVRLIRAANVAARVPHSRCPPHPCAPAHAAVARREPDVGGPRSRGGWPDRAARPTRRCPPAP